MIYRCSRKVGMYVYLRADMPLDELPEELTKITGQLEFSFDLKLTPDRKLARQDTAMVLENLHSKGFHLQMPPPDVALFEQDERLPSSLDVG